MFIGKGRLFGSKKTAFNGLLNWSAVPFDSLQIIFGVLFRNASRITLCNLSDIIMVLKLQGLWLAAINRINCQACVFLVSVCFIIPGSILVLVICCVLLLSILFMCSFKILAMLCSGAVGASDYPALLPWLGVTHLTNYSQKSLSTKIGPFTKCLTSDKCSKS